MIKTIKQAIERWRNNRQMHRYVQARRYAEHDVQLCEYDMATYICVHGVPYIDTTHLNLDIYAVLEDARRVSSDYIADRRHE